MSEHVPKLHGVLVTYKRPDALRGSLDVLGRQTRRLDALVVVDNATTPEVEAIVGGATVADRVGYVASPSNLGPAGGIALGMRRCLVDAADDDWLCILDDDDPLVGDDLLARHLAFAECAGDRVAGVGAGGAVFDWANGRLYGVRAAAPDRPAAADYLKSGWCPLYRVRAIREVGVFDERLFFGFDDLEYGLRLRAAGWTLLVYGMVDDGGSGGPSWRVGPLDWRRYYSLRNLVYLLRSRGHPGAATRVSLISGIAKPLANLLRRPRFALRHLTLNARALRDGWTGRLGQTVAPGSARRLGK